MCKCVREYDVCDSTDNIYDNIYIYILDNVYVCAWVWCVCVRAHRGGVSGSRAQGVGYMVQAPCLSLFLSLSLCLSFGPGGREGSQCLV